ncbi:DSBA thioredoxin domain protein [Acidisarcina polymorpha]|uniref:DSBA thioredoxin domain protein n=1 Tax=Acidisarcina polymorpha TaxID=2211140 RepID=A0A2Z5FWC7_9BACT|nr:thioredoxin domain-containing protein [Acidisarcina polymorpha]AXC10695.1 DSBA thioredoxin domain protein [Acidisarcina polymorpha]
MSFSSRARKSGDWFAHTALLGSFFAISFLSAFAQNQAQPPAQQELPAAPAQASAAPQALTFATPDPKNFTADKPTSPEINDFLKATWGYNPDLGWQVEAVAKTPVPGISKVTVAIGQKSNPAQVGQLVFFVLPDGRHIISQDEIVPFGPHPFEENRKILEAEAAGPARGSASKALLIVEFADFQCPHCKDAQPTIDRMVKEFPNARFVYESFPLPQHSEAPKAAAYGVCVQKAGGDAAFFKYADQVFANQAGLTPEQSDQTLKDVVTKIGLDPAKITACSTSSVGVDGVKASLDLAHKLEVRETPFLYVNGRGLPIGGIQYDQLKSIAPHEALGRKRLRKAGSQVWGA